MAYTTVSTVLGRLVELGWAGRELRERAYVYRPIVHDPVDHAVYQLLHEHGGAAVDRFVERLSADPVLWSRLKARMKETKHDGTST